MTTWRYQPVFRNEHTGEQSFGIISVYLTKPSGYLTFWTDIDSSFYDGTPNGETLEEIKSDIQRMLDAVNSWVAVDYDTLAVGMQFERIVNTPPPIKCDFG